MDFPEILNLSFKKIQELRYGENPHQKAAFYQDLSEEGGIFKAKQLHGKELSFNNILDLASAYEIVNSFEEPTAVIIKHNNPCGVASSKNIASAFSLAYKCDPLSAFGGIIGLNKNVDEECAKVIKDSGFMEAIIAPSYEENALKILKEKKDFRIMELPEFYISKIDIKKVPGGILVQEKDLKDIDINSLKIPTLKKPTEEEMNSLIFAWKIVKNVKSNAIVLAQDKRTVGIGTGQTSRVDSVLIAIRKAKEVISKESPLVMASDAFFPKPDAVLEGIKFGVSAIIQPGGSIADNEIINICNSHNVSMVFTGIRHFKH
jgi:phosphoribosylaminoimidazolecarboxamide formyltransferase/IMP cyclohydrolase